MATSVEAIADNLEFAIDEYGMDRTAAAPLNVRQLREEVIAILDSWLSDASIDDQLDTSRWRNDESR